MENAKQPLTETITYSTECRNFQLKTIDANKYKEQCENFDCYEVIPDDRKVKPHFDIEIKPEHCEEIQTYIDDWTFLANIVVQQLYKHFPNLKAVLLNASSEKYICCKTGKEKWINSLHLIITNYKISKKKCGSIVKVMNEAYNKILNDEKYDGERLKDAFYLKKGFKLFDESIYAPNKMLRSAFANKTHYDKTTKITTREVGRPFIIENDGAFEDTVVSAFFDPLATEIDDDPIVLKNDVVAINANNSISQKLKNLKEGDNEKKLEKLIFFAENGFDTFKEHLDLIAIGYALAFEFKEKGEDLFLFFAENHTSKEWDTVEEEYKEKYKYFIDNNNSLSKAKIGTIYWIFKKENLELFKKLNKEWNNNHTGIDMISGIMTTGITADYFKELYGDVIITVDEIVYMFNGIIWVRGNKRHTELACFIDKVFYKDLIDYGQEKLNALLPLLANANKEEADLINKKMKLIYGYLANCNFLLRNGTKRGNYLDDIVKFTSVNCEFDRNPYLFAFNNKIWDLNNACWIQPEPSQFICKTAGYDYETIEPTIKKELKKELDKLINDIFPNPLVRDFYLTYLSTGLSGIKMDTFMIATGVGGNGKGLINGLMIKSVGEYGYIIPSSALTQEIKLGANPELANLNNIRFALTTEPDIKKKFCCSTIKTITGEATLPVRQLYSSKVGINLNQTTVCEANDVPPFDEVNQAVNRRVKATEFVAVAIDKCDYDKLDDDEKPKYCIKNEHYVSDEFKNKMKQLFFEILTEYFTTFKNNKYVLPEMPLNCKKKVLNLLASSDGLYSWFEDKYEKANEAEPIPLTQIFNSFSNSEYYQKLSKAEQRNNNRKHFIEKIEINIFLQKYIKRKGLTFNKNQLKSDSIVGWKLKEEEKCDNEGIAEAK